MKILLVEDDQQAISTCREYAESYTPPILIDEANDVKTAVEKINSSFDAAIVDLRLAGDDSGNEFIIKMQQLGVRIPTVIHTGTPDEIDSDCCILRKFTRGENGFKDILDYLTMVSQTGIAEIIGMRGFVEEKIQEFYKNVYLKYSELWVDRAKKDPNRVKESLLRSLISRMDSNVNIHSTKLYPEEFYIPSEGETLFTGSIMKDRQSSVQYVILSPSCDLVIRANGLPNVCLVTMCEIRPIEILEVTYNREHTSSLSKSMISKMETAIGNKKNSLHFLPKIDAQLGGFVDFTRVVSVEYEKIRDQYELDKVRISPCFTKNILSRFSSYYARQGQPDIDSSDVISELAPISKTTQTP